MEIRVLRYFLAVAKEGSITAAANLLHLTQPTLSRQLKDLETELGQKLLIRGNHSVSLTPEGIILRKRAEEIIELVDKTESEFNYINDNIGGDIYIGCGETESMKLIAEVIKDLQAEYPNIKFHLASGDSEDLLERLDKGLLDFGILIQPIDLSKYDYLDMNVKDTWGIIIKKDSPLVEKEYIERSDLINLPLILSRQTLKKTLQKNEFIEWFGSDFDKLNIIATYNLVYNAAIMVEKGIGTAMTLDKLVNTTMNSNVCFRPLKPKLEVGISVAWKKNQVFSKASKLFLAKLYKKFDKK